MIRDALIVMTLLAAAIPAAAQTKAYVAHPCRESDGTRALSPTVIDTGSATVVATIPVGASPSALAASRDGAWLYVMTDGGVVEVIDLATAALVSSVVVGSTGDLAVTPDGARVYVAAGLIHVIDTATATVVASFAAEAAAVPDVTNTATSVTLSPDGARAYVGTTTFSFQGGGFGAGGSVVVVDTATNSVSGVIGLGSLPGSLALTPDGSRLYAGIQSTFVNTGYGSGFFPGRVVRVIDTATSAIIGMIDLGASGPNWTQQNTAAGLGVTPDRSAIYISVPRLSTVAVASVNTNAVTASIAVTAGPQALAVAADGTIAPIPYVVAAVDDAALMTTAGGTVAASVLANDTFGGVAAAFTHVALSLQSSTNAGLTLDAATGLVGVAPGTPVGVHDLVYRLCEIAAPSNCDDATVRITVREVYPIVAGDDAAASVPARTALANVLVNDTLNGAPATTATVTLSQVSSTTSLLALNVSTGSVFVYAGAPSGAQTLVYRICEKASPINCDDAAVTITVTAFAIDAVDDTGAARRTGGVAVASVLANDRFNGAVATTAKVRLSQLSSGHAGITLNVTTGVVSVAAATPVGSYALGYRICEIASPSNCDDASVAVTVQPALITAANDTARGSSKVANTALASVLTNDRLAGLPVTTATVQLSFVSLTPANSKIRLDLADGSVDVLGKTNSGIYTLVYEICEIASPGNCARGSVRIDLSGS